MSDASLTAVDDGQLRLAGVLDHASGAALHDQGLRLIASAAAPTLVLDCSAVTQANSVGLALLLAFQRQAARVDKQLRIHGLPRELCQMADACGVAELLPESA